MTNKILLASGTGYAGDKTFEPFDIIAQPLPGWNAAQREARVFGRTDDKLDGCDYGSHVIALAVRKGETYYKKTRGLFLLVQHGGGTRVYRVPTFYDRGEFESMLLALPERLQYSTLYTMYRLADDAGTVAREETSHEYAQAFIDGRLKKSRPKRGRVRVTIAPKPATLPEKPITERGDGFNVIREVGARGAGGAS